MTNRKVFNKKTPQKSNERISYHANMIRALFGSSSEELTDVADDSAQAPARGKLEFIAFVLWYMAMFLCCIVPTCCAYRRRRRLMRQMNSRRRSMEIFLQQQHEAAAAEGIEATTMMGSSRGSNLFIWSGSSGALYYGENQVLTLESLEGEVACGERRRRLEVAMKNSTFVVKEGDIIHLESSDNKEKNTSDTNGTTTNDQTNKELEDDNDGSNEGQNSVPVSEDKNEKDIEIGTALNIDEANIELRLPFARLQSSTTTDNSKEQDSNNRDDANIRNKTVPGVCAICLCSYEVGDRVTYSEGVSTSLLDRGVESGSSSSRCPHAFHTDCIVQWLAKKNDACPECPCCRRPFCSVAPLTTADLLTLNPPTTARGMTGTTSVATPTNGASTRTIPMRYMNQIPMIALPAVNSDNGNNNDSEQRFMVLHPRSEIVTFRFTGNPR